MPTNDAIGTSMPISPTPLFIIARKLNINEEFDVELNQTAYALDATTSDLCLSVFPRAHFRQTSYFTGFTRQYPRLYPSQRRQTARCQHPRCPDPRNRCLLYHGPRLGGFCALIYLQPVPGFLCHPCQIQSSLPPSLFPPDRQADRTYTPSNHHAQRILFRQGLSGQITPNQVPQPTNQQKPRLLNQQLQTPAPTIAELYRCRWQVELFFKWIKHHLRIKSFYGTSHNAVKTQVCIAVSVYVLVGIIRKRLNLYQSLYTILQILSVTAFERTPLNQLLTQMDYTMNNTYDANQLNRFD